jgi:dipeptide/tripeptide permease
MGLQASSALVLLFSFLAYVIPIFGGWWADVYVGRYKAIIVGVLICGLAHIIQVVGAIPSILQKGPANAAPPFILGLILLALGAGIFKPNVSPTILDQQRQKTAYTNKLKSGETVIVDPEATTTRIMLIFYGFINIGALFMLATTYAEKYVGYWLSFLLTGVIYLLLPVLLAAVYKKTYKEPPSGGSELTRAFKITVMALRQNKYQIWRRNFWDAANPTDLRKKGVIVNWTRNDVNDVARTVGQCLNFVPDFANLKLYT